MIVDAIRELVSRNKIKQRQCALAVAGYSVIIKKITLPLMTQEELDESIQWEAEQYIPFDISDVYLDVEMLASALRRARWTSCWWLRRRRRSTTT